MKNLLAEKPAKIFHGRLLASINFVNNGDLKDKNVLDIGCGFGWCEVNFLQRGVKKITAMEISEEALETVRQNIKDERLELKTGVATKLPFEAESFDTIVSWEVIEHIPKGKESKMFSEINRVLKNNGVLYLSTPHSSFLPNALDPAWWLIGHRHYRTKKLIKIARADFIATDIKILGGFWSLINTLNMYIAKWIFRRDSFFKDFFNKKENAEYKRNDGFANIFIKFKKI